MCIFGLQKYLILRSNRYTRTTYLMNNKLFVFVLLVLIIVIKSNAQSSTDKEDKVSFGQKRNIFAQVKFDYGGISPKLQEHGIEEYYGLDLRLAWQKRENTIYSTIYRAPKYGFGFYSGSFRNDDFGEPNGVYGFFESQIGKHRKKLNWIYSIGFGLAFNFNYFDREENPINTLIGSHKNFYVAFSIEGRYNLTKRWVAGLGLGLKHFSNGRFNAPNSGLNMVPITITTEYDFGNDFPIYDKTKLPKFIPFNMISIFGAGGIKQFETDEAQYFKSTLSVNAVRQFSYKFRYGVGFEIFYTAGSLDRVTEDKSDFNKQYSYGFTGLFEWLLSQRLYIPINIGFYLNKNKENFEEVMFNRIGLRYLIGSQKKMMIGIGLKITELHADYIELTIGYTFKNDKNKYELLF